MDDVVVDEVEVGDEWQDDDPIGTWMPPNKVTSSESESTPEELALIEKEAKLIANEPVAEFKVSPTKTLKIYPKPEGQMRPINQALQEWWDAEAKADRTATTRWRFWFWRRYRVGESLLRAQKAKFEMFQLIFADAFDHTKHQELSEDEFLAMTESTQAAIYSAFKRANDGTTLVRAILGDKIFEKKKEDLAPVIQRVYTPS